jgi:hypothetical protein
VSYGKTNGPVLFISTCAILIGSPYCLIDTILQRNCIVAINPYLVGTRKFHREEIMLPTPSPPEVS